MRSTAFSVFKRDFLGYCSLEYDKPAEFATSQWHGEGSSSVRTGLYLAYRWLLALYVCVALVTSIVVDISPPKWPIYITNWGMTVLSTQLVLAAVLATKHARGYTASSMTILHKSYWLLNGLCCIALFISVGYWVTCYDPELKKLDFSDISTHLMNSVVVVMDIFIVAHPIKLYHGVFAILLTAIYSTLSAVYFVAGGTDKNNKPALYSMLNWELPLWTTLAVFGSAIFIALTHVWFWSLFLLRRKIALALMGDLENTKNTSQEEKKSQNIV